MLLILTYLAWEQGTGQSEIVNHKFASYAKEWPQHCKLQSEDKSKNTEETMNSWEKLHIGKDHLVISTLIMAKACKFQESKHIWVCLKMLG